MASIISRQNSESFSDNNDLPKTGPPKPERITHCKDDWGVYGYSYEFNFETLTDEESVAAGPNFFRTSGHISKDQNCVLCKRLCRQKSPDTWRKLTKWIWCDEQCWKHLCWRYHVEYLETNKFQNSTKKFIDFLDNENLLDKSSSKISSGECTQSSDKDKSLIALGLLNLYSNQFNDASNASYEMRPSIIKATDLFNEGKYTEVIKILTEAVKSVNKTQ
jgi:hypothetical protein